ncbi:MAG: creatininase family protein [Candidatus Helarchaeota archaeon]
MVLFENLTWQEIEEYLKSNKVILVPTGVYEEHGFHLPVSTDNVIGYYIAKKIGENLNLLVAPLIPFGVSRKTREFPGSVMIQFETFKHLIEDILKVYIENGFKKIIIFSFHGSSNHLMALNEAAYTVKKYFNSDNNLHIYIISSHDLEDPRILKLLKTIPIHAGELETSLMLYLAENLVKTDKLIKENPKFPDYELLLTGKAWMKTGVMGDPTKADKDKGKSIIEIAIEILSRKISKII